MRRQLQTGLARGWLFATSWRNGEGGWRSRGLTDVERATCSMEASVWPDSPAGKMDGGSVLTVNGKTIRHMALGLKQNPDVGDKCLSFCVASAAPTRETHVCGSGVAIGCTTSRSAAPRLPHRGASPHPPRPPPLVEKKLGFRAILSV